MYNYPMFSYPASEAKTNTRRTSLAMAHPLRLSPSYKQRPVAVCPSCGHRQLVQIHRRTGDRIASLFVNQRRFECMHFGCRWQGNLKPQALVLPEGSSTPPEFASTPYDITGLYINLMLAALVGVLSVGMWALLSLSLH